MNKTELTNAVAEKTGLTKKDADKAVKAIIEAFSSSLAKGESVQLVGFGTFSVGTRAERAGKNPKTGEALTIPACKTVKFKAGKTLKDTVNA